MKNIRTNIGVAIVTPFEAPASASMVRIHAYIHSISTAGINTFIYHHILGRRLSCSDIAEEAQSNTFWSCGNMMLSKWRIVKMIQLVWSYLSPLVFFTRRRKDISVILLYAGCYLPLFIFYRLLSWLLGFKLVRDLSEKPFLNKKQGFLAWVYLKKLFPLHDGVIAISSSLRILAGKYLKDPRNILYLPIMVDMTRFPEIEEMKKGLFFTLTYCGNLQHEEEMHLLFRVTAYLKPKIPFLYLQVIGGIPSAPLSEKKLIMQYKTHCRDMGISDITNFTGTVEPDRIPRLLSLSDVLILPRPFRDYSDAGFPTKLGEYLASGRPVVTTATGDIPDFLDNRRNAILISTDDADDIAEGVLAVQRNESLAGSLGRNGRKTAQRFFSINSASPVLRAYFTKLITTDA